MRAESSSSGPSALEIESVEAEAWAELQGCLPPDVAKRFGVKVQRRGGAVLLIASGTRELAINKAMGLGLRTPLTELMLDDVIATYAAAGAERFTVQWHPHAQPAVALEWFTDRGFVLTSGIAKLCRQIPAFSAEVSRLSPLRINEIGEDRGGIFTAVVARSLGVPEGLEPGIRSTLERPGWRYYLVSDGERPIAGGALCVRDRHAWFGFGATLESDRRRGAQTLLLERRLRDAAADGCEWASADTLVETVERPNQSYRNMRRMGFADIYDRPNFVLELSSATPRPTASA